MRFSQAWNVPGKVDGHAALQSSAVPDSAETQPQDRLVAKGKHGEWIVERIASRDVEMEAFEVHDDCAYRDGGVI